MSAMHEMLEKNLAEWHRLSVLADERYNGKMSFDRIKSISDKVKDCIIVINASLNTILRNDLLPDCVCLHKDAVLFPFHFSNNNNHGTEKR